MKDFSKDQLIDKIVKLKEENVRQANALNDILNLIMPAEKKTKPSGETKPVKQLPKKSELLKEQVALEKQYIDGTQETLNAEYTVKVGSKSSFDDLYKMAEHKFEFDNSTSTGLALLFTNLKQQKPYTRDPEWNGNIQLKTSSCIVLWRMINAYRGKGFYEAKEFLAMLQLLGPELSKTVKTIDEKNMSIKGLHTRLNEIDNILDSGDFETDLTEEEEKSILATAESVIKTEKEIEDEVNPIIEA